MHDCRVDSNMQIQLQQTEPCDSRLFVCKNAAPRICIRYAHSSREQNTPDMNRM